MFAFATSNVRSIHTHVYQLLIGRVKRAVERGELRVACGISHERAIAGTYDQAIQAYIKESRAHYLYHYTRRTSGVVLVSQDW